jgi:F-type H+-transporting ATPase subunit alpha
VALVGHLRGGLAQVNIFASLIFAGMSGVAQADAAGLGTVEIKAMKKVAGPLKLDLAQYRALEAFARFGSDLDKTTLQQLRRGARLLEVMKQPQYSPVPVEDQIVVIYAASSGFMDELPVESIKKYETELLEFVHAGHANIIDGLRTQKALTDEIVANLNAALKSFTERFAAAL